MNNPKAVPSVSVTCARTGGASAIAGPVRGWSAKGYT